MVIKHYTDREPEQTKVHEESGTSQEHTTDAILESCLLQSNTNNIMVFVWIWIIRYGYVIIQCLFESILNILNILFHDNNTDRFK